MDTDRELKEWRLEAHKYLDPLWKNTRMKRMSVYRWLRDEMGLTNRTCHISMFSIEQCKQVIELSKKKYRKLEKFNGCKAYDQTNGKS